MIELTRFMTYEWCKDYVKRLNDSFEFAESTTNFSGDVLITALNGDITTLLLRFLRGKCVEWKLLIDRKGVNPCFEFRGTFRKWKMVFEREIDINQGIFSGDLEMVGDGRRLWTECMRLSYYLGALMSDVETTF